MPKTPTKVVSIKKNVRSVTKGKQLSSSKDKNPLRHLGKTPTFRSRPPSTNSLVDTPQTKKKKNIEKRSISLQNLAGLETKMTRPKWSEDSKMSVPESENLILKTYAAFLKNSWRKTKTKMEEKTEKLVSAQAKISKMEVQICALKNLLQGDRDIIMNLTKEVLTSKRTLLKFKTENGLFKKENDLLRMNVDKFEAEKEIFESDIKNLKKEFSNEKSRNSELESLNERSQEKIDFLEKEVKNLSSKIVEIKKENYRRELEMNQIEKKFNAKDLEIQAKNETLKHLLVEEEKTTETIMNFRKKIENLENELLSTSLRNTSLSKEITTLKITIAEKENEFEEMEKIVLKNYLLTVEMEAALETSKDGIKHKIYSMIDKVVQIPIWALKIGAYSYI